MLVVESLVTRYGAVEALHGVSLTVGTGEAVAIVGPNGAGKTTLLRTISGLVRPAAGTVEIDGRVMGRTAAHRIARLGVSHVPEGRAILSTLTVRDNLLMGGYRLPGGGVEERMAEMIDLFPVLGRKLDDLGGVLSGGEQQMLAIARGLMAKPRLLMIDEPSMGLAPRIVGDVLEALKRVVATGTAVLVAEQNAGLALEVADRAYVMVVGDVVTSGNSADLDENRLLETYLA
ncbi:MULTISPECIES: ABC transporter ATP-binding protein [Nonomuraea]|uniref:ABC transporter ATP-binding protein n=2 Tax=Nonomuraea TaxID=83681 RepID=A0ABW1C128_9ACTN|nr:MULTISPECIES: ABC transporter ATP-binding protein [Nonomuraea]MDA0647588.1 ABC transporter ATP-binding protein [Nonomuraea ferruginea]TXK40130.1 ABC transporter ATP-binding protein [Nonomuraea sp. C10]